ncbi:GLE1-domain-containing protein [Patellaria atrata CBS 101060]|uniref:mRNA export factor GLE1 n=1 Tax=Patellaria atrata CBS 101060 TaxID=1346257 RepID=A0A9P4VU33_9PEZI|nr:GLE1-domain-containing protein [Patellaria atrata CBS 101060]
MSSPRRSSLRNTSSPHSSLDSPAKQLHHEARRRRVAHTDPDHVTDSPSRQLLEEFQRMQINQERGFQLQLEKAASQQKERHDAALAEAARRHEEIRKETERALEVHRLEVERAKIREEAEEQRRLDDLRQAIVANELAERRRLLEEQRRREEEEDEKRRIEAEEKAVAEARIRAEAERKAAEDVRKQAEKADAERRVREAVEAAKRTTTTHASSATQPQIQPTPAVSSSGSTSAAQSTGRQAPLASSLATSSEATSSRRSLEQREATHQQYLDLHERLKIMRQDVQKQLASQGKEVKNQVGDLRRRLNKCVGQLTIVKDRNKVPTLRSAAQVSMTIDIRPYIIAPLPDLPYPDYQYPTILLFFLNFFSKYVIAQFASECSSQPAMAEPLGILVATVFSDPAFKWQDISLVDVFLAKMRKSCPVLWGIYGPESSERGRGRLGWRRVDDEWISAKEHGERMTGLSFGFASVTLRDFTKSKHPNPVPNYIFWDCLASILATPPAETTQTHFLVLKALVENSVERFVQFYGRAGLVALRLAVIEFPERAEKAGISNSAVSSVKVLRGVWKTELKVTV